MEGDFDDLVTELKRIGEWRRSCEDFNYDPENPLKNV